MATACRCAFDSAMAEAPLANPKRASSAWCGCLLGCCVVFVMPLLLVGGCWWWNTEVTFGPIAEGDGWVAFQRRVDYAFPADADTSAWLARSLDQQNTWVRLAPTDTVRDATFEWVGPRHLRVRTSAVPTAEFVRDIEGIRIEWQ